MNPEQRNIHFLVTQFNMSLVMRSGAPRLQQDSAINKQRKLKTHRREN